MRTGWIRLGLLALVAVLDARVPAARRAARDDLAGAVLDDVLEVEQRLVDAGAAVDDVALAVPNRDAVVPGAAADDIAHGVARPVDVLAREGEQAVVAVAAVDRVAALVGEDRVVAGVAVRDVVTEA